MKTTDGKRSMNRYRRNGLAIAVTGVGLLAPCFASFVFAQTPDPPTAAAADATPKPEPNWRDRLSHGFHVSIPLAPPASSRSANPSPPSMTDQDLINRLFGHGSGASSMKVRDITQLSNRADIVLDPACKEIVQPFGVLDSAASLAVLAAKVEVLKQLGVGPQMSPIMLIRMAAIQLNWLPTSTERSIGQRMLAASSDMILDEDHNSESRAAYLRARQTLAEVLAQIHEPLPYTFQIYVLKEKQENAASLPGGTILVDEDLFDRGWNPSVAFFKVAHEVSHVLQRHQTRMYQARLVDGLATLQDLRKLIATAQNQPAEIVGRIIGLKHLMVEFTASQELQADACAVRLIRSQFAQADLNGMHHAIIDSLGPVEPTAPVPAGLLPQLSTVVNGEFERHPNTRERSKNLDAMFASKG